VRKEIVLLVISMLLLSVTGCGGHDQPGTSAAQPATAVRPTTQQTTSSNPDATGSLSLYDQSLVFPDGKVITSSDQEAYNWKGLSIRLCSPMTDGSFDTLAQTEVVLANHCQIVSRQPINLALGQATLVLVDRTPPAASGLNMVTHECWLILFHPDPEKDGDQIAYAIWARLGNVSSSDATSEILQLAKGWNIPALQNASLDISIKLGPASGPQVSVSPGATANISYGNGIIPVFVNVDDKILSSDLPVQVAVHPDGWHFEAKNRPDGSTYYFSIRVDPSAPRTGEITLSNICDQNDKVLVAGPITFWITLVG
jgi:hypothetical protein